ncbi:MAG: type I DNA topoisomerase, partial [Pacificimonas sp.]
FTLSPVLWRKLPGAKSAGRVQSVALRLITEREREIEAFDPREYWSVAATFALEDGKTFPARLVRWQGKTLDKFDLANAASAGEAKADVEAGNYSVSAVDTKPVTRNPYPPFTTSTLQQEASRKLGMSASDTMRTAQALYEAGHITYMRTDGVEMAGEAIAEARRVIEDRYSAQHLPKSPRVYKSKAKNAQEAHEAIRPTALTKGPEQLKSLPDAQRRLYDLIWKRTLASQMASASIDRTTVTLTDKHGRAELRATGQVIAFPGFLALYQEDVDDKADGADDDDRRLPKIDKGATPKCAEAAANQHFTQPPPRYSEASLVKRLEELGIGRPSTYAAILEVLKARSYVRLDSKRFIPEEKGRLLTAFLERFFTRYVEYDFTAGLEEQLDDISAGDADYKEVLRAFWADFFPKTQEIMERQPSDVMAAIDEFLEPMLFPDKGDGSDPRACPSCDDGRLALRGGKFGAFIACSNYPGCKYTREFGNRSGEDGADPNEYPKELGGHPLSGELVTIRSGRFGLFVQEGEDKKPPRASIPKDIQPADVDLDMAVKLLSLPRVIGQHPETGKDIETSIGRYGPYLRHDGKYAKLTSTAEVFETGMNAAVVKLAEAAKSGGRRKGAEPLKIMGAHPISGDEIKLMEGRYGPYVTDGTTNASLKRGADPEALTLEEAAALIDERAAKGPAKKKRKAPAKKKPAAKKKAPAKKKATSKA